MVARSVCVHPYSMLSVKPWVYPVHRYCTMYSLSCWDSGDSLRFIGLGDGCHSLTGQPGSHRALAFRASPRETMQLCPPVHELLWSIQAAVLGKIWRIATSPADNVPAVSRSPQEKPPLFVLLGKDREKSRLWE